MTRWEKLLNALGVDPSVFERDHEASFDLSPTEWLKDRIEELQENNELPTLDCDEPCCKESE